jgi:hypothetical protein
MDIEKLLEELRKNLLTVLGEKYKEFKPEIQKDVNAFLENSKEKLIRWSVLVVDNSLTQDEFAWLLKSQQDLVTLKALQGAGLSKIKLNNIKNTIFKTVLQTIILSI